MKHFAASRFWHAFERLSPELRALAEKSYKLLVADPRHPSLQFKRVGRFWSARVGHHHRALAVQDSENFIWFWIGPHDEYERLIR